jgi:hypothetical protein
MTWNQIGEFTLTQNWQYTAPLAGQLFRIRHLTTDPDARGLLSQGFLSESIELLDTRRISPKGQHDLIVFECPEELTSERRIAVKLNNFATTSWTLAIDVFEVETPIDEGVLLVLAIAAHASDLEAHSNKADSAALEAAIAAHESAQNPHPEYALSAELEAALASRVTDAELSLATADFVTSSTFVEALTSRVTGAELADAIANKVTTNQLAAALATKQSAITLTVQTTDATTTEMVIPQRILIPANSSAGYEIQLIAQTMGSVSEFVYWLGSGAFHRRATAASTVLQNSTSTRRSSAGNGSSWVISTSADTINGGLKLQVKGEAGKTIKWVASVKITEVS